MSAASKWRRTLMPLLLICSATLSGCQSAPLSRVLCEPTPPQLSWQKTPDGGACLNKQALGELVNYIHDLRDCIRQ
ncbi:MAG: hypothetical protein LPH21_10820 [Shewanella sp.]|nr:hypothetical protein [Shewanella sp.]